MRRTSSIVATLLAVGVVSSGCSGHDNDRAHAAADVRNAGHDAARDIRKAAEDARVAARQLAAEARSGAHEVVQSGDHHHHDHDSDDSDH